MSKSLGEQSLSCERCEDVGGRRHVDAIAEPDRSRTWSSTAIPTDGCVPRVCAITTIPPTAKLVNTPTPISITNRRNSIRILQKRSRPQRPALDDFKLECVCAKDKFDPDLKKANVNIHTHTQRESISVALHSLHIFWGENSFFPRKRIINKTTSCLLYTSDEKERRDTKIYHSPIRGRVCCDSWEICNGIWVVKRIKRMCVWALPLSHHTHTHTHKIKSREWDSLYVDVDVWWSGEFYLPAIPDGCISWTKIPKSPLWSDLNPTTLNPKLCPSGLFSYIKEEKKR
jgi:hypothetical protein